MNSWYYHASVNLREFTVTIAWLLSCPLCRCLSSFFCVWGCEMFEDVKCSRKCLNSVKSLMDGVRKRPIYFTCESREWTAVPHLQDYSKMLCFRLRTPSYACQWLVSCPDRFLVCFGWAHPKSSLGTRLVSDLMQPWHSMPRSRSFHCLICHGYGARQWFKSRKEQQDEALIYCW